MIALIIGVPLGLAFVLAQGGAVLALAGLFVRLAGGRGLLAKVLATLLSWATWCALTLALYDALGGDGGLFDGLGLVVVACVGAFVSAFALLPFWHRASRLQEED